MTRSDSVPSSVSVSVRQLYQGIGESLGLRLLAGAEGLDSAIFSPRIQKLGLALSGYTEYVHSGRVQFMGRTEMNYLQVLTQEKAKRAIRKLFGVNLCAVVVTTGLSPPPELLTQADRHRVPLLQTEAVSSRAISEVTSFLSQKLAPSTVIHGVLTEVFGIGVLLVGESGIGKSECGLDLILRGHRLVSDDVVVIRRQDRQALFGSAPEAAQFLMEVRGLGILNIMELFGVSAVSPGRRISLVIRLERWKADSDYDRLGVEEEEETILEVPVPRITLPVAPGRNLATLVEVAVRVRLLREQGYHSSQRILQQLDERRRPPRTLDDGRPATRPEGDEEEAFG